MSATLTIESRATAVKADTSAAQERYLALILNLAGKPNMSDADADELSKLEEVLELDPKHTAELAGTVRTYRANQALAASVADRRRDFQNASKAHSDFTAETRRIADQREKQGITLHSTAQVAHRALTTAERAEIDNARARVDHPELFARLHQRTRAHVVWADLTDLDLEETALQHELDRRALSVQEGEPKLKALQERKRQALARLERQRKAAAGALLIELTDAVLATMASNGARNPNDYDWMPLPEQTPGELEHLLGKIRAADAKSKERMATPI